MVQVGARIKEIRKKEKKTLAEISSHAGISVSFLSQIENGKSALTLVTLNKIADALGVPIKNLLEENPAPSNYVRNNKSSNIQGFQKHYKSFDILSGRFDSRELDAFHLVMAPNFEDCEELEHPGEEFYYILKGTVTVVIDNTVYEAKAGESIHFPSSHIHKVVNRSDEELEMICVVRPVLY